MLLQKEREQIVACGIKASEAGLCPGTSGNMSIYDPETDLMAISPSGVDYYETRPEDVVLMDLNGHIAEGTRKPSSEWGLHAVFYKKKPEARAVVHTHSIYCTTFAILGRPIRSVHYAMSSAGVSEIPVAPYYLFGTPELADAAILACGRSNAVLLANHGAVVCGPDMQAAYSLAVNLEFTAELQYRAESLGVPNFLTDLQMKQVRDRFTIYGQGDGKSSY